jgi:DNA-binding CsgD family transcriptional regulator
MPMLPVGSIYLIKKETSKIDRLSNAIDEAIRNTNNLTKRDKLVMPPKSELTDNQIEIMRLVANGHSNMQIAKLRGINEKSVEQTISRLAKELGLKSDLDKNLRVQISRLYYQMTGAGPTKHAK